MANIDKLIDEESFNNQSMLEEPITYLGLKRKLEQARNNFLEDRGDQTKEENKTKRFLDPYEVSLILKENCHFCMFKHNSRARLATYDCEQGIYTFDYTLLKRYISYVAPRFNESKATTVIYHLTNQIGDQPVIKPFDDPNMVPVGNGIYNPAENVIYPFSPSKPIMGKVRTCLPYEKDGKTTIQRVTRPVNVAKISSPKISNIDGSSWDFDNWLMSIANNDTEICELLWQVIAVTCNANRQMGKGIFLLGNRRGNNGKGTFQTLIQNLVGEQNYAMKKINQFSERFALEDLVGVSVVIGDDNPSNVVINDKSNFNSIITNDPVSIEPKGEKMFTEKLNLTVIQSCNAMPRFSDDGGVYRRMLIVPFNADFNGTKENVNIKNKYLSDKLVLQYVLWKALQKGIKFTHYLTPKASKKALKKYEQYNKPLVSFVDEVYRSQDGVKGLDSIERLPLDYLYGIWKTYAKENSYRDIGKNKFNEEVFDQIRKTNPESEYIVGRKRLRTQDAEEIYNHRYDDYKYYGDQEFKANDIKNCIIKVN